MITQRFIGQGRNSLDSTIGGLVELASAPGLSSLIAGFAYVTNSGVKVLKNAISEPNVSGRWSEIDVRFIVGIDWFRSDPSALAALEEIGVEVRVHDGKAVVQRAAAIPVLPFHPKMAVGIGRDVAGMLVGSGNLSRNGLGQGVEAGSISLVSKPTSSAERIMMRSVESASAWLNSLWLDATPLREILSDYRAAYAAADIDILVTDDIATRNPSPGLSGLSLRIFSSLLHSEVFWVETRKLSTNLGPQSPGNQVDLSAMMRIFFGFPSDQLSPNTNIGSVTLVKSTDPDLESVVSLRFSDNSMDVLGLPRPGGEWWSSYDHSFLKFTRVRRDGEVAFEFAVLPHDGGNEWVRRSERNGTLFAMRSGRRWGTF